MLTEIDIKRIMETKYQLSETLSEPVEYVLLKDDMSHKKADEEMSIYERQGYELLGAT